MSAPASSSVGFYDTAKMPSTEDSKLPDEAAANPPKDPYIIPGPNREGIDVELAMKNLPEAELEALKAQLSPEEFSKYTPEEWKKQIVMNRITSAICHYCRSKGKTPLSYSLHVLLLGVVQAAGRAALAVVLQS
jgi:hypothetical protein